MLSLPRDSSAYASSLVARTISNGLEFGYEPTRVARRNSLQMEESAPNANSEKCFLAASNFPTLYLSCEHTLSLGEVSADLAVTKLLGKQTITFCFVPHAAGNDGGMHAQFLCQCHNILG